MNSGLGISIKQVKNTLLNCGYSVEELDKLTDEDLLNIVFDMICKNSSEQDTSSNSTCNR